MGHLVQFKNNELKFCIPIENGQMSPTFFKIYLRNRIFGWKNYPNRVQKEADSRSLTVVDQLLT